MPRKSGNLSSWVRQLRHRAKKYDLYSDLALSDVAAVFDIYGECLICGSLDDLCVDTAFYLKNGVPNVQANLIIICENCMVKRGQADLFDLLDKGVISDQKLKDLLTVSFALKHGGLFKEFIKHLSGIFDE